MIQEKIFLTALLLLFSMAGVSLLYLSLGPYGTGISPDSVGYISVARNITEGKGITTFTGEPLVSQPPLYPVSLAVTGWLTGLDPLIAAGVQNCMLAGLIVVAGGLLCLKVIRSSMLLAFFAFLTVLFSKPLFLVCQYAWSEPLFIFFELLSFILAGIYLKNPAPGILILFALVVALIPLIRYAGVIFIPWGFLFILFFVKNNFRDKVIASFTFAIITSFPVTAWLIRNYYISKTLSGPRVPSPCSLNENLHLFYHHVSNWYLPSFIRENIFLLSILLFCFFLFLLLSLKVENTGARINEIISQTGPLMLFVVAYSIFILYTASKIAIDRLDCRLLSPLHIPLTVTVFSLVAEAFYPFQKKYSKTKSLIFLLCIPGLFFVHPFRLSLETIVFSRENGRGYTGRIWRESPTVDYIRKRKDIFDYPVYTNDPAAIYFFTGKKAEAIPFKRNLSLNMAGAEIQELRKILMKGAGKVFFIWFKNGCGVTTCLDPEELKRIFELTVLQEFEDGEVYSAAEGGFKK